ncbi:MAG: tol-pal system protein YbgF, partial [Geobacteraceae bacterium]|nr:tol-pal system protein YbgF [Geobacteraceae bacterium]
MVRIMGTTCMVFVALVVTGCAPGTMGEQQRSPSAPLEQQVEAQQLRITAMEQQLAKLSNAQRERDEEYTAAMERLDAVLAEIDRGRKADMGARDSTRHDLITGQPRADSTAANLTEQRTDAEERTPTDIYRRAFAAYTTGKHDRAQELFEEFATSFPNNDYVANARFWQGEACLAQGLYSAAEEAFAAVEEFDPQSSKVPFAKLKQGLIRARQGDTEGARKLFENVQRNYPDTEAAEQA